MRIDRRSKGQSEDSTKKLLLLVTTSFSSALRSTMFWAQCRRLRSPNEVLFTFCDTDISHFDNFLLLSARSELNNNPHHRYRRRWQGLLERPQPLLVLLVLSALHIAGAGAAPQQSAVKHCAPECTEHGTCNLEEGRCDCPWGYGDADCSVPLLAACRLQAAPGAHMQCHDWPEVVPRACECLRQCKAYALTGGLAVDDTPPPHDLPCFERTRLPVSEQLSLVPGPDERGVKYFRGYDPAVVQREVSRDEALLLPQPAKPLFRAFPLASCPHSCHHRGHCLLPLSSSSGAIAPVCVCFQGFLGKSCQRQLTSIEACPSGCNGAGHCEHGFCRCHPGHFGPDCSRTKVFARKKHNIPSPQLLIYIYDLPHSLAGYRRVATRIGQRDAGASQTAAEQFLQRLQLDSAVRTDNPWEASLFYVPAHTCDFGGPAMDPGRHIQKVVDYIRTKHTFWNETGGRNHIFFVCQEAGWCRTDHDRQHRPFPAMLMTHHCPHHPGANNTVCFDAMKDVCVVPWSGEAWLGAAGVYGGHLAGARHHTARRRRGLHPALPLARRPVLFYFQGDVRPHEPGYSGGVRQQLVALAAQLGWDPARIRINPPDAQDRQAEMRRATFCLAPAGLGAGLHLVQVVAAGCIPVIIQEGFHQFFDDVLPYWKFSVRLRRADLPNLPQLLSAMDDDEVAELQRGLVRYHRAFLWGGAERTGRAYHTALHSLQRVYQNLRSAYAEPAKLLDLRVMRIPDIDQS